MTFVSVRAGSWISDTQLYEKCGLEQKRKGK